MFFPDPQKWVRYYENLAKGSNDPAKKNIYRRTVQRGGSIGNSTTSYMESIDAEKSGDRNKTIEIVSPAKQISD